MDQNIQSNYKIINKHQYNIQVLSNLGSLHFSYELSQLLRLKYRILSKNAGVSSSSKNNAAFIDPPFYIDCYATAYLYLSKQICEVEKINLKISNQQIADKLQHLSSAKQFKIYNYFHQNYYVVDGHKFGASFMAYQNNPEQCHAKYLIFTENFDLNHLSRLAAACKKQGIFVNIKGQNQMQITACQRTDNKKRPRFKQNFEKQQKEIGQEVQFEETITKKIKIQQEELDS